MDDKGIFNAAVCLIGIAIFLIHSVDLMIKKQKRPDEKNLLAFFVFTAFHFACYLAFTLIKPHYTSNGFIMSFYTAFYVMNNVELIFLFAYAISYIKPSDKLIRVTTIINIALLTIFIALDLANIFGRFFFTAVNGVYQRSPTMFISQGYQLVAFIIVFLLALTDRKLSFVEKAAFILYCLLPLAAIVIQNLLPGYAIGYLSIILAIEILFLFANVRKNAYIADEERKNKEAEVRIMMSQIRPHFIYNTLSSISTLIKLDPPKAQKALDDFTEYLRANLSALSDTHLIPFSDELRHIKTYVELEQVRFEERIQVHYDIEDSDFLVAPLSVQPLVENAIKHGILQKIEGGTVSLKTYRRGKDHIVEIEDDGVGFDVDEKLGREHVGLKNVSFRLRSMCDGELDIQSEIGKGTKVTITFHEEGKR